MKTLRHFAEAASWLSNTKSDSGAQNDNAGLSGYAQKAIGATQKDAGDKWDSVKDKYIKAITAVDKLASGQLKNVIQDTLKATGAGMDAIIKKLGDMVMTAEGSAGGIGDDIAAWCDSAGGDDMGKMASVVSIMCGALRANKSGIKPADITTIMNVITK